MRGRGKWGRTLLVGTCITAAHFVVTFLGWMSVLAQGLGEIKWWANIFVSLLPLLGFPASFIIGRWTGGFLELSNEATLSLMIGTSVLWGTALALVWRWWRGRRTRRAGV